MMWLQVVTYQILFLASMTMAPKRTLKLRKVILVFMSWAATETWQCNMDFIEDIKVSVSGNKNTLSEDTCAKTVSVKSTEV